MQNLYKTKDIFKCAQVIYADVKKYFKLINIANARITFQDLYINLK